MPIPVSSSSKRRIISNPFIKPENRSWSLTEPASLTRSISPPLAVSIRQHGLPRAPKEDLERWPRKELPCTAAVEAGEAVVTDYLAFWTSKLSEFSRLPQPHHPQLSIEQWSNLYKSHAGSTQGCHFVIHQHDHPVAGTHYDLRLQCNATSSISFAIMYGLPGDPNSRRLNRNAAETRVHCLWNHLIETASLPTGSMLIWDTGFYEVLTYEEEEVSVETDDDSENYHSIKSEKDEKTEQEKLHTAFRSRKIRLRLHGTRLPKGYTISLRLTRDNYRSEQPGPPSRKRKQNPPKSMENLSPQTTDDNSDAESDLYADVKLKKCLSSLLRHETPPLRTQKDQISPISTNTVDVDPGGSDLEGENQEEIRKTNTYPGATNNIGSIHQRKWYLSMDRKEVDSFPAATKLGEESGFGKKNENGELEGFERFHVLGRDVERSVITGRLGRDIFEDEGVVGFVPRGQWRGVTE